VVGCCDAKYDSAMGDLNEDHKWIHVDVTVTFYLYKPEVGQVLKGLIKRKGHQAAVCVLFNLFTATVFASDETELSYWNTGEEIEFQIQSFKTARKGPMLRGRSLMSQSGYDYAYDDAEEANFGQEEAAVVDVDVTQTPPKTGKKRKRQTVEDEDEEETITTSPKKKKKRKKEKKEPKEEPMYDSN